LRVASAVAVLSVSLVVVDACLSVGGRLFLGYLLASLLVRRVSSLFGLVQSDG
jgi:hypothetical protein